jgi:DNA-binding CsgD family transcriptional regulator
MAMDRLQASDGLAASRRTTPALRSHDFTHWKHLNIGKQDLIAIPRAEWRELRTQNGSGMRSYAVGFVRLMGLPYVLVPNDELQMTTPGSPAITTVLTSREIQIAHFVAEGKCDKVIAFELGISEHTVREHMRRIFRKLQVSKRAALVARMIGHLLG